MTEAQGSATVAATQAQSTQHVESPLQEVSEAPPQVAESAPEPAPEIDQALLDKYFSTQKRRLKVNGQDTELTYNDIFDRVQKEMAADQKYKKAAELEKTAHLTQQQLQVFLEACRDNPSLFFKELGIDERAHAENILAGLIQKEVDPETWELKQKAAEYDSWKAKQAKEEKAREVAQAKKIQAEMAEQARVQIEQDILGALAAKNIPDPFKPEAVKRMASYMENALNQGLELQPGDYSHIADIVMESFESEHKNFLKAKAPRDILESIPYEDIAAFVKDRNKVLKNPQGGPKEAEKRASAGEKTWNGKPLSKLNYQEHREYMDHVIKNASETPFT